MSGLIKRTCQICGRITEDDTSRCAAHKSGGTRPRRCAECGATTTGADYCLDHAHIEEERRRARQTWRAGYSSREYRVNRRLRYEHAHGKCEECRTPIRGHLHPGGEPWECDHVQALSDGGSNAMENLRCRCLPCHYTKTAQARRSRGAT